MAAALKFLSEAQWAHMRLTTGVTATDGSSQTDFTWIGTAPSGDWMPVKIIVSSSGTAGAGNPADCILTIYLSDGTTSRKIRTVDLGDAAAGTIATPEGQWEINFGPEWVFPTGTKLQANISLTPTAGNIDLVMLAQKA